MKRDSATQLVSLLVLVLCLVGAGALAPMVAADAGRAQLTYTDQATEGDPPEVAIGIAMGAFRGLFVNYLWIRANKLKEEGKFYEAIELSSAITRLQPRFPRVWIFHAWNMAYNISVATNTAQERWQWVSAGINLLRDEAIPRNPNDVMLHREIAWTFIHKIQGYADDANHYYKRELAKEWAVLLGEPPRQDGTGEQNRSAMMEWLRPVVDAPVTLEGAIRRELAERARVAEAAGRPVETDSRVKELAERIKNDARLDLDMNLLRFIELRRAWIGAWYMKEQGGSELRPGDHHEVIDELMGDERFEDAWPRLLNHVRHRLLVEQFHMEPDRMLRYTEKYGPLDWRHPATHAIYWAARGVEEGLERQGTTQFDTLNTDRIVMHAIQELFRFGTIQYDLITGEYFALNNFDWVDPYGDMLDEVMARGGIAADIQERTYTLYGAGYENFLKDVIRIYFRRGEIASAEKYHQKLRTWKGINTNDFTLIDKLKLPLAQFVEEELKDRLTTPHVALNEMEAAITDAFLRGLSQGRPEVFKNQMEYAQRVRQVYLETQNNITLADPEAKRMAQYVGQNFAEPVASVLLRLLSGGNFGAYRLGPQQSALLYRRAPAALQRIVYDDLSSSVTNSQGVTPEVFGRMFPEPPGMEEYRLAMAGLESESDKMRRRGVEFERDMTEKRFLNEREEALKLQQENK